MYFARNIIISLAVISRVSADSEESTLDSIKHKVQVGAQSAQEYLEKNPMANIAAHSVAGAVLGTAAMLNPLTAVAAVTTGGLYKLHKHLRKPAESS